MYLRVGEASHPGPIHTMPGDGHCLYHALGWWDRKTQSEIRRLLATIGEAEWRDICPWDDGSGRAEFVRETLDPNIWRGLFR